MNLVVDIGNSSSKVGIFEKDHLLRKEVFTAAEAMHAFVSSVEVEHAIVGSVTGETFSPPVKGKLIHLNAQTALPITNGYRTPKTLGVDRLAAACGAWAMFPGEASLVIDAGTCINMEYISADGTYGGGSISPGVRMRFEAMHTLTARLPLAQPVEAPSLTGNDTISSLQSGVMVGILMEMQGAIGRYQEFNPGLRVILCGGDSHFFENHLKPPIFVAPDLVLMGLNRILLHHVK